MSTIDQRSAASRLLGARLACADLDAHADVLWAVRTYGPAGAARALGVPLRTLRHWLARWPTLGEGRADGRLPSTPRP